MKNEGNHKMSKGKMSYIRLLAPVLLFAGVQMFAQATADSRMPVGGSASHKMTRSHADPLLISDRAFLMKSIEEAMPQRFEAPAGAGCNSNILSVGAVKPVSSDRCPIIDCPAPPPGCSYGPPDTGANGCPISCGPLVCGSEN